MAARTATTTWTIEMRFEEDADRTHAVAVLRTPAGQELRGHGQSRRNPVDRPQPLIGEEVAGARALSNLAHELLEYAAAEIESNVRYASPS
jgi:hypothetical protein